MRLTKLVTGALAIALPAQMVLAQNVLTVPTGNGNPKPVSVTDPVGKETPEEIAKDAARDLKDTRFYNRPGATRAQYDADWQACRLIARGSRTPSGSVPYYYNPAVISPLAAGIGAGIGGAIAAAIQEGVQRRANRRACLLIRGWRMVDVPPAQAAKMQVMTDDQRNDYFNSVVGAERVNGEITERVSFTQPDDPALGLNGSVSGPTSYWFGKKIDPAAPFLLGPNEAAIVVAYSRLGPQSAGQAGTVQLTRYDPAMRDLVYAPKNWKKMGDKTVYGVDATSRDRKAGMEVHVFRVTAGDYVISSSAIGKIAMSSYCFGAPTFHANAGEILYVGDFVPVVNAKLRDGCPASLCVPPRRSPQGFGREAADAGGSDEERDPLQSRDLRLLGGHHGPLGRAGRGGTARARTRDRRQHGRLKSADRAWHRAADRCPVPTE